MAEELKAWFDEAFYRGLAASLKQVHRPFDTEGFVRAAIDDLGALELKQRLTRTTELCRQFLPPDYGQALDIVKAVAPRYDGQFRGMFAPEFVGLYGLDDPERSLDALHWLTRYSSSEFAVRPYLRQDLIGTLKVMRGWAKDENHHVRRLASEGSRPRLPWSFRLNELIANPEPVFPILKALKADPELYVRKSVANHLNDISKDHPETMLDLVSDWNSDNERTPGLCGTAPEASSRRATRDRLRCSDLTLNSVSLSRSCAPIRARLGLAGPSRFRSVSCRGRDVRKNSPSIMPSTTSRRPVDRRARSSN